MLGIYQKKSVPYYRDTCSSMSIATVFTIVMKWKQPKFQSNYEFTRGNNALSRSYRLWTKIPIPCKNYLPLSCSVETKDTPKQCRQSSFLFFYSSELTGRTILLKTSHTWVMGCGENKLASFHIAGRSYATHWRKKVINSNAQLWTLKTVIRTSLAWYAHWYNT